MATKADVTDDVRVSARERLLVAADELFYAEGIHTVGIDRVIERAGVAKATLYNCFGSKDELIRAYLERRHTMRQELMMAKLARFQSPREKLLGIFDALAELIAELGYSGCAFMNALAEGPSSASVQAVSDQARGWTRSLFAGFAREAGAADPEGLARQLVLLYDGAVVSAKMDGNVSSAAVARAVASELIDAAIPARPRRRSA